MQAERPERGVEAHAVRGAPAVARVKEGKRGNGDLRQQVGDESPAQGVGGCAPVREGIVKVRWSTEGRVQTVGGGEEAGEAWVPGAAEGGNHNIGEGANLSSHLASLTKVCCLG